MAVQVGLKDLYYAILKKDDTTGVEYDKPVRIVGAINAKISPTTNTETLYADDGPAEVATAMGEIGVDLNVTDLPLETQASLLGHTVSNGILIKSSDDQPPYVAIGFRSMKSNGKYRYIWLYKGKFTTPEHEYNTKEDTPSFQTPTISGAFVKRDFDSKWQIVGDEDAQGFTQGATWFDAVVEVTAAPPVPPDTTPPTVVSVVPANNATAIPVTSDIVWTFSEAIQASTINSTNFTVKETAGTTVAGSVTADATNKVITFNPDADLKATTEYTATVTTGVKDVSGNSLASDSITKFTTA